MAEIHECHAIMTLDSDFSILSQARTNTLALIQPDRPPS
jgi:hypothetical protein